MTMGTDSKTTLTDEEKLARGRVLRKAQDIERTQILPPLEFTAKMHDWMAHFNGDALNHQEIAKAAWKYFMESQYYAKN